MDIERPSAGQHSHVCMKSTSQKCEKDREQFGSNQR